MIKYSRSNDLNKEKGLKWTARSIQFFFSTFIRILADTLAYTYNWSRFTFPTTLSQIARFMGPMWGPPGADRTQEGPMLTTWPSLSGMGKWQISFFGFCHKTSIANKTWISLLCFAGYLPTNLGYLWSKQQKEMNKLQRLAYKMGYIYIYTQTL